MLSSLAIHLERNSTSAHLAIMKQNALAKCNPALSCVDDVYYDAQGQVRTNRLSSYLNIAVPELLNESISRGLDMSLFSYQLERQLHTPELREEFAYALHNALRMCNFADLKHRQHALDLTQDFGGTGHFLAHHFSQVDSLKVDLGRAQHSRQRFPNNLQLSYFSQDPELLILPERHYDFIYIGQLEALELNKLQAEQLLTRLQRSLSDTGVLLVTAANRDRLSKWLNLDAHESAPTTPHKALYSSEKEQLFNLAELQLAIDNGGFGGANINASFAARNQVANLFSLEYLDSNRNAINHFYRIGSVACSNLSEYLMYQTLLADGNRLANYASRYVAFLANDQTTANAIYQQDFSHFAGNSRLPQWRTITSKASNESSVVKQHIYPDYLDAENNKVGNPNSLLTQNISPQPFHQGPLLLDQWLSALTVKQTDFHDSSFDELVNKYHAWLKHIESTQDFKRVAYDLLPFNVVCDERGEYQIIDPEWQIDADISPDFVLFRALFWLAFENRALMAEFCEHWGLLSIGAFVKHYLSTVCSAENLDAFIALEERAQAEISHEFNAQSVRQAMHHSFLAKPTELSPPSPLNCSVTWADEKDNYAQSETVHIEWQTSPPYQTLSATFQFVDSSKKWLRVDPIDKAGMFQLESNSVLNKNEKEVWAVTSSADIADTARLCNVVFSGQENGDNAVYVALNDDPFLLFDLSQVQALDSISQIRIIASLSRDPIAEQALAHLSRVVDQQAQSIVSLGNKEHETRADINQLNTQLEHSENKRLHLQAQLAEMNTVIEQNQQLQQALLSTASARFKRLVKTLLEKLGLSAQNAD